MSGPDSIGEPAQALDVHTPQGLNNSQNFQHSADMNKAGVKNGRYIHDKHGTKPPGRKYALIGDIFSKQMEFNEMADKPNHVVPKMQKFKRHREPHRLPKEAYMKDTSSAQIVEGVGFAIPANIKHQFGSDLCDMLLADAEQVKKTLMEQRQLDYSNRRVHTALQRPSIPVDEMNPHYHEIGLSLRSNVIGPSVTTNHTVGTMNNTFNEDVHRQRVPDTDEFRIQRDELSGWWQQHTTNNHLNRQWGDYAQSRPKPTVNWDRNAKRPTPPPKPKEPKPKPKPKPGQSKPNISLGASNVLIEDFEFMTPPLTPLQNEPPAQIRKISAASDDFWDFYSQELPLP